jgi:predicted DsbA family dithiol-disulfide isomerase
MQDTLFAHQQRLENGYLVEYANDLGLDIPQFLKELSKQVHVDRINEDIEGGMQSGVKGILPTRLRPQCYLARLLPTHY